MEDIESQLPHHFSVSVQGAPQGAQALPPLWLATALLAGLDKWSLKVRKLIAKIMVINQNRTEDSPSLIILLLML